MGGTPFLLGKISFVGAPLIVHFFNQIDPATNLGLVVSIKRPSYLKNTCKLSLISQLMSCVISD